MSFSITAAQLVVLLLAGTPLSNSGFEIWERGLPLHWTARTGVQRVSGMNSSYSVRIDVEGGGNLVSQEVDPSFFISSSTLLSGFIRTEDLAGDASLVVQIFDHEGQAAFVDDMRGRAARGTSSWERYETEIPMFPVAAKATISLLAVGSGSAFFDGLELKEVSTTKGATSPDVLTWFTGVLDIIEQRALRSDSVDWKSLRSRLIDAVAGAQENADTHFAIRQALSLLNDGHSYLLEDGNQNQSTEAQSEHENFVSVSAVDGMGHIVFHRMRSDESELLAAVEEIRSNSHACGWVVDLRSGGGNQWAALGMLLPFLDEGPLAYAVDRDGSRLEWIKQGSRIIAVQGEDSATRAEVEGELTDLSRVPLAVLIDRRTASASEAVALSLRGRANTRFYGEPTAGVATLNTAIPLDSIATLVLATGVIKDRNNQGDGGPIQPDEFSEEPGAVAERWLAAQCEARNHMP